MIFYRIILSFVDISARTTMHKLVLTHIRYLKIDVVTLVYMYVQVYFSQVKGIRLNDPHNLPYGPLDLFTTAL